MAAAVEPPVFRLETRVSYSEAVARQEACVEQREEALFLCEHPPTITLGTATEAHDLLLARDAYPERGVEIYEVPRGGQATYHGPGQLVMYPVVDLRKRGLTVHGYLRFLERFMIDACSIYGIQAHIIEGKTGVWVVDRKIGFIGVRIRRGFSYHGVSLNITPQHEPFRLIVPCGMPGLHVTSIEEETATPAPSLWQAADELQSLFFKRLSEIQP